MAPLFFMFWVLVNNLARLGLASWLVCHVGQVVFPMCVVPGLVTGHHCAGIFQIPTPITVSPTPIPKALSSQKGSHQNTVQNTPSSKFTALTTTIFVTISVFVSRGHFRALHKALHKAYTRVQVEAGNPAQGPTQAPYTKVARILCKYNIVIGSTEEGGKAVPEKRSRKNTKLTQNGLQKSCQNIGIPSQIEDNKTQGGGAKRRPLGAAPRRRLVVFDLVRISYVLA